MNNNTCKMVVKMFVLKKRSLIANNHPRVQSLISNSIVQNNTNLLPFKFACNDKNPFCYV